MGAVGVQRQPEFSLQVPTDFLSKMNPEGKPRKDGEKETGRGK